MRDINFQMSIPKRSMDEISLQLTERCIELESRKYIPSEVGLDYSQTQLSILEPQEPASPLPNHSHYPHEHLPKIEQSKTHHRYLQLGEGLYGIESPENLDRIRGGHMMISFHHARDRPRQSESQSLQSKPNKVRGNQRTRCGSLGHKPTLPPKLSSAEKEKENQQSYNALKLRLEEQKRKYQPFRVTFRGWEYKKATHLHAEGEKSSGGAGFADILAKKIRLDYNQAQQKKYLQRIILNRQSILHVSQRLSKLPNIQ